MKKERLKCKVTGLTRQSGEHQGCISMLVFVAIDVGAVSQKQLAHLDMTSEGGQL